MAKTTRKPRGSARLQKRITKADLEKILRVAQVDGVDLVEFFPLGIPAPDGGWGTWHASPSAVLTLIDRLLRGHVPAVVKVFPLGIPSPDVFKVVFEAGSARTRG